MDFWQKALAANPRFQPAVDRIYETSMERRDFQNAERACDAELLSRGPSQRWAEMRARCAETQGHNPEALLLGLWRENPNNCAPGELLAQRCLQRGDLQNAMPLLHDLENWRSAEAAFQISVFHLQRGDFKESEKHLQLSIEFDPNNEMFRTQMEKLKKLIDGENGEDQKGES